MEVNLNQIYQYLMMVVPKCSHILRESFHKDNTVLTTEKGSSFDDFINDTNKRTEDSIIKCLQAKWSNHTYLGKTTARQRGVMITDEPTWLIEPIDGTTNLVHKFPQVSITVAFFLNKQVQIGVVYNPITETVFSAIKGQGAFMNGKTIHASLCTDLSMAQVCTEFGHSKDPAHLQVKMANMSNVITKCHSIRSIGLSSLGVCYVACGACDVFYDYGTHIWKIAAGVLIAKEAGCLVTDPNGGEFDMTSRRILITASQQLTTQFVPLLNTVTYDSDSVPRTQSQTQSQMQTSQTTTTTRTNI
jgi:fructose-1,6-bisphosphatase/inositol monophosphatase family enzyme